MKFRLLAVAAFCAVGSLSLTACNGVGSKDSLLAKINDEQIYKEDLDMAKMGPQSSQMPQNQYLYEKFYARAALVSKALAQYPELNAEWEEHLREMDPRLLTVVYQRYYAMERLTYSDTELKVFYNEHRSLFPSDSTGDYLQVRGDVAMHYYVAKHKAEFDKFLAERLASKEEKTSTDTLNLKQSFVDEFRRKFREEVGTSIREKQHVNIQSLPAVDVKKYYNSHKDQFMTVAGYSVYHVQGADSARLASLALDGGLEQFKQVAAAQSENKETAKDSGFVGFVKKDFALPYGIGMVEQLSSTMEGKSAGFVTPVLRDAEGRCHRFYLAEQVPSKLKTYDRVESFLRTAAENGGIFDVDSSFALIVRDGKNLLTEAELVRFKERYYGKREMNMNIHDKLVNMLADNFAFALEAKDLKLDHSWEYRALVRDMRLDFIQERYLDKVRGVDDVSEDSLKALFDRVGSPIHVGYDFEKAKDDLRQVYAFPKNMMDHEYLFGYRMIYAGKTYEQSVPLIYNRRVDEYKRLYLQRLQAEAYDAATVHLYDTSVSEYKPEMLAKVLLTRADSLYKAGQRAAAFFDYRKVMYAYAENDSLFERVAYEMAQLQNEGEEYLDAEAEYYAFYKMWPKSVNAEKSMFSRGFILNENVGMNDKAMEVFDEFLKTYPNSELKESVDWLIQNIKSNGKLADELMKKISAEE